MAQRPYPIEELPRGPGEEWRHIPGWGEAYAVSSHGRVARLAPSTRTVPGQILAGSVHRSSGQRTVQLTGPRAAVSPGRLVWEAFRGPMPPGMRVAHLDGAGGNDRLENLALVPSSAGTARARAATRPGGGGAANARLSDAQVAAIRAAYAAGGATQKALAARYGVHQTHISAIVRGAQRRGR